MRYISTRGGTAPMRFTDTVLTGLAPDGGLLLPESIPDVRDLLDQWRDLSFVDLAAAVVGQYATDIDAGQLAAMVRASYATFDDDQVAPVVAVGDIHVLELFHGPTLAFKDVALQLLGNLFEHVLHERDEHLNILGATSGDTGSAAIAGIRGKPDIDIFVMYPKGRTSALQERQMACFPDANVHALALEGSFDDCQRIMKEIFNDLEFKGRYRLGAVNSVNWARVLAQTVYYFFAAFRVGASVANPVSFSVPTGNFGDIFAGYLATRMGLPVERLILATNENDIVGRFFQEGVYQRGTVHHTIAPSMDIQVASNFERYLFYRFGGDPAAVVRFMAEFEASGRAAPTAGFAGRDELFFPTAVHRPETIATVSQVWNDHGYLLDPHSAIGYAAARQVAARGPVVALATAHPAKFPDVIEQAVGEDIARHPRLDALKDLPLHNQVLPAETAVVRKFLEQHAA